MQAAGVSYIYAQTARTRKTVTNPGVHTAIHASMLTMNTGWLLKPYASDIRDGVQACIQALQTNTHLFPKSVEFKLVAGPGGESVFSPTKAYANALSAAVIGMIGIAVVTFLARNPAHKIPGVVTHSLANISGSLYSQGTPHEEAVTTLTETQRAHKLNREMDPIMLAEMIETLAGSVDKQAFSKKVIDSFNRKWNWNQAMKIDNNAAIRTRNILAMSKENRKKLTKASIYVDR